jgi:hypothetical protein
MHTFDPTACVVSIFMEFTRLNCYVLIFSMGIAVEVSAFAGEFNESLLCLMAIHPLLLIHHVNYEL